MRILIIGGNGRTGKLVLDAALARGHTVTALVRNPSSLSPRSGLTIVEGTPLKVSDLERAFDGAKDDPITAVIVTLNAARVSDNPWAAVASPPRLMADSNANCVSVMRRHGLRKIVILSAFGVADSWPNLNWLLRLTISKSNMTHQFEDHGLVDKEIKESGMDYVLARPVMLKEGDAKPVVLHGNKGDKGVGLTSGVTRKSVAEFLVDAAEKSDWDRTTPVLTN